MDKNYFEQKENENWKLLCDFNEHTHLFDEIGRMPQYYHTDATGQTTNKLGETRKFNLELKTRDVTLTQSGKFMGDRFNENTLYIESHKVADLLLDQVIGYEGLYVNFLNNNVVVIFNVGKLKVRPKLEKKRIPSKGYQGFEMAFREGLHINDAAIYKDNKLVKRIGEEWKIKQDS